MLANDRPFFEKQGSDNHCAKLHTLADKEKLSKISPQKNSHTKQKKRGKTEKQKNDTDKPKYINQNMNHPQLVFLYENFPEIISEDFERMDQ